ncbi:MAG: ATP-binding protein [Firmicutes bacterium]|nr:ATP-binding protein [Bacillota bacterium]
MTHASPPTRSQAFREVSLYLHLLLGHVDEAVKRRKAIDEDPDNNFRGLYITEKDVTRLLAGGWPLLLPDGDELLFTKAIKEATQNQGSPISRLQKSFGIQADEVALLLIAVAPDIDRRFEMLYGYLNDDVTKRRATVGLALELAGLDVTDPVARGLLDYSSPLIGYGLIVIEDGERPFLTRSLKVPDRVTAFLLDDTRIDSELLPFLDDFLYAYAGEEIVSEVEVGYVNAAVSALVAGTDLIYLHCLHGGMGKEIALAALQKAGLGHVSLDMSRFHHDTNYKSVADIAGREALLSGSAMVVGPVDSVIGSNRQLENEIIRLFTEQKAPVILYGYRSFDPKWSKKIALVIELEHLRSETKLMHWQHFVSSANGNESADTKKVFLENPSSQNMTLEQVWRTSRSAKLYALAKGSPLDKEAVSSAVRFENTSNLEQFARRIKPEVGLDDLILPQSTLDLLNDLISRVRYREIVLGEWNMRPGAGRGRGIAALFAGESGTGKTMSAEVIANSLGYELYTINLSTVVDKYVGETEKNLEKIFIELDHVNAVLLFDEADAIFGKRSEVKDAHDRYANIEVAYLLQKLEAFDGLALLSTNLRSSVDEAFTRRLDAVIEFPMPNQAQRLLLWQRFLAKLPVDSDVDFQFLAGQFELSGGNIASVCLTGAYMAASKSAALSMSDIMMAVYREYKKLGRLTVRQEFGQWLDILDK